MSGFWKKSLVYFGVIEDEEEFDPLPLDTFDATTVRTIPSATSSARVVNIGVDRASAPHSANPRDVCVMEPHNFADASFIGDRLKQHSATIVNLRHVELGMAERLVDFACGLTYMSGGDVKKVAGRILLLTPPDVHMSVAEAREVISPLSNVPAVSRERWATVR
jgi:cell division inhibitor SepF